MSILHHMDCSGEGSQPGETRVCFWCPGCKCGHWIRVAGTAGVWGWNQNETVPTFSPSILCQSVDQDGKPIVCHSYVENGQIRFLSDCTHPLAGRTVPMEEF